MKRKIWRKHHKWLGLAVCFFMLMFCMSGILLNHRQLIADVNVSRSWLPSRYEYRAWNGGLLRGTLPVDDRVLIYGTGGMYLADTTATDIEDFNDGLPEGADYRQIRNVVKTHKGNLFAVSAFGLYRYGAHGRWQTIPMPLRDGEKLTDLTLQGDTLVVLSRSNIYVSLPPYRHFKKIEIQAPKGYDGSVTAFRTVWLLHSGELFGKAGKLIVDAIAVVLLVLCLTGLLFWLLPKWRKRKKDKASAGGQRTAKAIKWSFLIHDRIGRYTIILTLFICITGWCLRPPVMIALLKSNVPALPGTILKSGNAWDDKLRMVRYDDIVGDWLLSTSEGFYSLKTLDSKPTKIADAPPVSVMGLNVWQRGERGEWLCGSFSGMTVWQRKPGGKSISLDYATRKPTVEQTGMPFGKQPVSGFSKDFRGKPFVVEYYNGTAAIHQPDVLCQLPMSLWNVALEIHSGRIYIGSIATVLFVFLAGILSVWCIWSGWKVRAVRRKSSS